jgi:hypothetical protein
MMQAMKVARTRTSGAESRCSLSARRCSRVAGRCRGVVRGPVTNHPQLFALAAARRCAPSGAPLADKSTGRDHCRRVNRLHNTLQ